MYENRFLDLGIRKEINKVQFKDKVMKHFPHAQEHSDGYNVILVFEQGMQEMLKQALPCDFEEDALILAKAAKIVRGDIFESNGFKFNALFPSECQKESVPTYLKSLVTMILVGIDLRIRAMVTPRPASLSQRPSSLTVKRGHQLSNLYMYWSTNHLCPFTWD